MKIFWLAATARFLREVLQIVRFPDQTLGEDVLLSHALRTP